jgi:cobalt-zinc-cadmium efflux system protein
MVAVLIGFIILWGAVRITRESSDILLEAVPKHLRIDDVTGSIRGIDGVEEVHDVHIWTITTGIYAMSAHVRINDRLVSASTDLVRVINETLQRKFAINHTTLQLECESCATGQVCGLGNDPRGGITAH